MLALAGIAPAASSSPPSSASAAAMTVRGSDSAAASSAADPHFFAFFAHVNQAGLQAVKLYDAASLVTFLQQSMIFEDKIATCMFLLQAVLLVEHSIRTSSALPPQQYAEAQTFGQHRPTAARRTRGLSRPLCHDD